MQGKATASAALNAQVAAESADAIELTEIYFSVNLDFSEASIKELERQVDEVHYSMPGGKTPENIDLLVTCWGSYIGEVFRRKLGAEWVLWEDEFGATAALRKNGVTIFPHGKVRKRFEQGQEHNLWGFFTAMRDLMPS